MTAALRNNLFALRRVRKRFYRCIGLFHLGKLQLLWVVWKQFERCSSVHRHKMLHLVHMKYVMSLLKSMQWTLQQSRPFFFFFLKIKHKDIAGTACWYYLLANNAISQELTLDGSVPGRFKKYLGKSESLKSAPWQNAGCSWIEGWLSRPNSVQPTMKHVFPYGRHHRWTELSVVCVRDTYDWLDFNGYEA